MPTPVRPYKKNTSPPSEKEKETPKRKRRTLKQINTLKLIHEQIDWYDILRRKYTAESTPQNKEALENHSVHLRNVSQLATYIRQYSYDNKL